MTLTIVITNHNRPKTILKVLDSIASQKLREIAVDILIIDDASSDPIDLRDLEKYGDVVKLHREDENIGVQAARNVGAKLAKGDFVLFNDDDDIFIDGALQKAFDLIFAFERWREYEAFGFPRTNALHLPLEKFFIWDEEKSIEYKNNYAHLGGDFTYILTRKFFDKYPQPFVANDINKRLGAESLGSVANMKNHSAPFWAHAIVESGADEKDRLTNYDNALKKAKEFAAWQQAEIDEIEKSGYKDKIPNYYNLRIKGLYTYLLLDRRAKEAREVLRKYNLSTKIKIILYPISFLPPEIVLWLLKIYRKKQRSLM
ncbi:MAG: glycosyltransferase [Helicobacteraceae bacterium]|nr:glycosyltransferase [Helicobacteraceae bacterium]